MWSAGKPGLDLRGHLGRGWKATLFWVEDYFQPVHLRSNKPNSDCLELLNIKSVSVSVLMNTLKSTSYFKSTFITPICIQ